MGPGDKAPDFTLIDQDGRLFHLYEALKSGPVVLFFYPMAFTPGCTQESCSFRDLAASFKELGAQRVGISANRAYTQKRFANTFKIDYPLLSDPRKKVASLYGVKRVGPLFNKRCTFVISEDAKIIGVIQSEFDIQKHINEALTILKQYREYST